MSRSMIEPLSGLASGAEQPVHEISDKEVD
jgi:hypothetical protein